MPPESILDILDGLGSSTGTTVPEELLLATLVALREVATSDEAVKSALRKRLQTLVSLLPVQAHSAVVEDLISIALEASLPVGLEGQLPSADDSIISLIDQSSGRRLDRKGSLPAELRADPFLFQQRWTTSTVTIICGLLYRRLYTEDGFSKWLTSDRSTGRPTPLLAAVMHAYLDSAHAHADTLSGADWEPFFSRFIEVVMNDRQPEKLRSLCASCIVILLKLVPEHTQFIVSLAEAVKALPKNILTDGILNVGIQLRRGHRKDAYSGPLSALMDHGLQWVVRMLAGPSQIPASVVKKLS